MSGYTEIALLQYELEKLRARIAEKDEVIAEAGEMLAMRDRQLAALKAENESLRKDAERYRWLRDATGETPLRPAAFGGEMYPDMRLKLDFPTIVSYDAVGNVTTLDQAIDAMAQGEQGC